MIGLAAGLACDVFVVVSKTVDSAEIGAVSAVLWLSASLGVWLGWSALAARHAQA